MTAAVVIAQATAEGVTLSIEDGYLACAPPATGALRAALRIHKAEILMILGSKTPEGFDIDWDGIEAVRTASRVTLPADEQPRPGLRPLTPTEQAQVRTGDALPAGVSYGQTATGQWRRLT